MNIVIVALEAEEEMYIRDSIIRRYSDKKRFTRIDRNGIYCDSGNRIIFSRNYNSYEVLKGISIDLLLLSSRIQYEDRMKLVRELWPQLKIFSEVGTLKWWDN